MYTWQINSLSPRIRKFRQRWRHCFQRTMSFLFWLVFAETWVEFGFDGNMTLFAASLCLLVAGNTTFLLHFYLPPPTAQNYSLRNRPHNRQLPDRISRITDCNFTVRMLYRNIYWHLYILDLRFVLFLCTIAVWQFAINEYVCYVMLKCCCCYPSRRQPRRG